MLDLKIIIGSTREGRSADLVVPWVVDRAQSPRRVRGRSARPARLAAADVRRDDHTIGDFADPTYSQPIVRRWNHKIKEGDAFLFVTPEYNHSVPGVLKNAIDSVFVSFAFRNKPSAVVGYSGGVAAGVRAVEHLAQIIIETDTAPLRNSVVIPHVGTAFDDDAPPPTPNRGPPILLDDLEWWGTALEPARAGGELPPAIRRMAAAEGHRR